MQKKLQKMTGTVASRAAVVAKVSYLLIVKI
jgi:hypothetical protein